ncbi:MAG TPA: SMP-30/gluconolactonase/LRE family protein [Polyangiaceae bacterium]|nr:SMP-30/gluconolactonase/LRE family protein [Polyangiaceae bacterium]
MLTRRTLLASAAVLPAALLPARHALAATTPVPALPDTVKSFSAPYPTFGSIERLNPALDPLLPAGATIEKLAEGFDWIESPLWVKKGGYLLFSEIPLNSIYKWEEGHGVSLFMKPAGYSGDRTDLREPGTNGLVLDAQGALIMCQHGNRRIAKLPSLAKPNDKQVALAEKFGDARLNSPNDLVVHSSGDIFFTDPPYGLGRKTGGGDPVNDPDKELKFQGVYRLDTKGKLTLVTDQLERPNGIALSPDEKTLYVANSHGPRPIIMAFDVKKDRTTQNPRVFFDGAELLKKRPNLKGAFDGMTVDTTGNLFATGPGGVLIITASGQHLGTIATGEATSNCEFGGKDGKTLYIAADMYLARVETSTHGVGWK